RGPAGVETRLVGRSRELGLGREALEALRAGRGGILVVAGDAGIGKSRLLAELRELAESAGSCWLEGRCVSYGESLPYWPFRDLLRGEWIGAGVEEPELRVRVGLRRRLEQLFGSGLDADALYPYLGGLLEVALENEAEAATSQNSRPRLCSGARSMSSGSCSPGWRRPRRSWYRARISTVPTRPPCPASRTS